MIDQEEIHKQCLSEDPEERINVLEKLKETFLQLPDKQKSWDDLHRLTTDEDWRVRMRTVDVLACALSYLPDNFAFPYLPNKQQAWNDLIKLITDPDEDVRFKAQNAVTSSFSQMSDKQQAWNDLVKLTNKKSNDMRSKVVFVLGSLFSQVPDKQKAGNDLLNLTNDEIGYMRGRVAGVLGSSFSYLPDKLHAWNNLLRLASDEDSFVRAYANHSLGKISIFKASQSENEEDYLKELEKAVEFFEKATREPAYDLFNPSQFCLPFYRSFYIIIFEKKEIKEEVSKYLDEAKSAIRGSRSRELLFEAIENLANALKEVQSLENLDLEAMKEELNLYRKYCEHAEELLRDAEEKAPFATITMRKGLPILGRNLKEILNEIQEKAKAACQEAKGTPTQEIACAVNREVQTWGISNQEEMTYNIENLIFTLESNVPRIPDNQYIFDRIQQVREQKDLAKQYGIVCTIIPLIPRLHMERGISDLKKGIDEVNVKTNTIILKLDDIKKELNQGFEKLDLLSFELGGKEGELIENFSKKIHELIEKRDKETLDYFLEEILTKENTLIEEIEKSSAPPEEKEESKRSILNIRSVIDKVKCPIKSFGKDVTKEIVVTYTAEEIVKLVFQLVSMTTLGVPIPPQILNLMSNMIKELKK